MKVFLAQFLWFMVIFIILTMVSGIVSSIAFPNANLQALGNLMSFPIVIISIILVWLGSRFHKLPGTKKNV